MPGCSTGRNIQKYKGAAASTLQDVTDNGNTTTGDLITTSGFFIGDGSLLTGISGASAAFSLQDTSDRGNTTSNTIQFTNTQTSFITSSNIVVNGNVTATVFYGFGSGLTELNADNISSGTLSNDRLDTKTGTGNIVMSANPTLSGTITGGTFSGTHTGTGTGLSSLNASNISTGTLSNDRLDTKTGTGNIVMSANPTLSGTITGGTFSGTHDGDGSGLSSINASNVSTGTLSISRGGTNITTYAKGDILIASGPNTLSNLALGTDSYVLTSDTTSGIPEWKSASSIGTTVKTLSNTAYIIGGDYNGGDDKTWSLKASTANSTDHIVIRDDSGNVYATEYHGDYIKHAGDIDTHLGFPSNDTFTVTTGGTERMKIDSNGTTIPEYIIHNGDTNTKFGFPSDHTFTVTTNNTERMKIDNNGTTIPEYIIHNGNTNTKFGFPSDDTFTVTTGGTERMKIDSSGTTIPEYIIHNGNTTTKFGFPSDDTFTVTTNNNERLRIDSSGRVGISNTNPQDALSVGGDINLTGKIKINGSTGNATQVLTSGGSGGAMTWENSSPFTGEIPDYITHTGNTYTKFGFPSNDTFTVTTHNSERLRIDSSGRVGISNTNPQDALSVGGDINLTGKIKINGSTGLDTQVLTSGGNGAMTWADAGAATNYWVRTGSSPNYTVTTSTPESKVGIAIPTNQAAVNQTLHIGSNVIVNDTGNYDVLRVNGNIFCTNYLFGDGSKIRNLNTIRTETGKNQISIGGDDGGPVLSWRARQIRYQQGSNRPDPINYGF